MAPFGWTAAVAGESRTAPAGSPAGRDAAVVAEVEGRARATGLHEFTRDQADPTGTGLLPH